LYLPENNACVRDNKWSYLLTIKKWSLKMVIKNGHFLCPFFMVFQIG
jgi:hypothetical protein